MKKAIGTSVVAFTLMAGVASAATTTPTYNQSGNTTTQTTQTTGSTTTGSQASTTANHNTPNIPNTGAGGDAAANALALTAAGAIVAGAAFALRKRAY